MYTALALKILQGDISPTHQSREITFTRNTPINLEAIPMNAMITFIETDIDPIFLSAIENLKNIIGPNSLFARVVSDNDYDDGDEYFNNQSASQSTLVVTYLNQSFTERSRNDGLRLLAILSGLQHGDIIVRYDECITNNGIISV